MMLDALPMVMHLGLVYRESFASLAVLEARVLLAISCSCSVLVETTNYRVIHACMFRLLLDASRRR